MSVWKKIFLIVGVVVVGVVDVALYWNHHLAYKAERIEQKEKKIQILKKASRIYPFDPEVYYALGNAHLSVGTANPGEGETPEAPFQKAVESYQRAIRLNPVSSYSHFGLGQAFYNMSFFTPPVAERSYEEYKKAALLAGHHTQIFFKVGRLFLSRWPELSEENRDFTVNVLRRIVENAEDEKFEQLMRVWEMNVRDYEVMERILPEEADVYRMYARFLGEKSLSLEERQRFLTQADYLDFQEAQEVHEEGENDYFYYNMESAFRRFQWCLNLLEGVKFYQNLTAQALINPNEFKEIRKSALLYLAKSGLEGGKEFGEVEEHFREYLSLEDQVSEVRELEEYLQNRGVIGDEIGGSFEDMELFSFRVYLAYKENRYRDIMRIGRDFQESFVMVPKEKRDEYVEILQIVGDANQKVDFIYDAGEFYEKALEVDPDNLEALVRLRQSYQRLNKEEEIERLNQRIDEVITAKVWNERPQVLEKGTNFYEKFTLDGEMIGLELNFEKDWGQGPEGEEISEEEKKISDEEKRGMVSGEQAGLRERFPLVSVFWNGEVVWEDYLKESSISLKLETEVGRNVLRVVPVNRDMKLLGISWK